MTAGGICTIISPLETGHTIIRDSVHMENTIGPKTVLYTSMSAPR